MKLEQIDHIVWAVPDLEEGMTTLVMLLGCAPTLGGVHPGRGTRNALLKIGPKQYLEILAPDPAQQVDQRWMGLDAITRPCITRWCMHSSDWAADVAALSTVNSALGATGSGQRERPDGSQLNWQMSYPLAQPSVELAPFLIQWGAEHPCDALDLECQLIGVEFFSPNAEKYKALFATLNLPYAVSHSSEDAIGISLDSPNGKIQLR